jgi:hypothetical protein
MRNPSGMELGSLGSIKPDDLFFLATLVAVVAAATSLAVFFACFFWFRGRQRRLQGRVLASLDRPGDGSFGLGQPRTGELVAQFRAKQGRQVISVLEADGKRFVHVDGEITAPERAKMVRYLKSEGFMS